MLIILILYRIKVISCIGSFLVTLIKIYYRFVEEPER